MKRLVSISFPQGKSVEIIVEGETPYEIVENLPRLWRKKLREERSKFDDYLISEIVPIHNVSGIRDRNLVEQMLDDIKKGGHILGRRGVPNIKLVVAPNGKLLLFDGHHSVVSYFTHERTKLSEIPYLVISAPAYDPVTQAEISYFFSPRDRGTVEQNWENYTVNWQAQEGAQLENREVHSIKELARQLSERDEGTVEH